MIDKIKNLLEICIVYIVGCFYLLSPKYRNLWMIIERGTDARDNGYFFFKYLRTEHPEIHAVYVITDDSPDRKKVEKIGEVIPFMSFQHKVIYAISKVKASTHHNINSPYKNHYRWADELGSIFGIKVMLQHGITKDEMPYFHYSWLKADLFICGALPEYEFIKNTFEYPDGNVKYTGFARYDNLLKPHEIKRQILVMPTWRHYAVETEDQFLSSTIYQTYQNLLQNKKLDSILSEHGYSLVFYPHYEMQKYINDFKTSSSNVKIADISNYDVQQLLMESEILITDFSSVFFDFAYMKKPLIFYQFDTEDYRKGHYEKGYFHYEESFGPIVKTEEEILNELEKIINNKKMEKKYEDKVDNFFSYRDTNNCERIFKEIKKKCN